MSERAANGRSGACRPSVLVTGASSGIGTATVRRLVAGGWLVFAGLHRIEQQESVLSTVADASNVECLPLDVTDETSIQTVVEAIERTEVDRKTSLCGLVNNAADENLGPVELLDLDVFRREIEVGYLGMVAVTKALLPRLREAAGRVVNLSSVNGRCTFKYHATTCSTKYAVEAFSDALRMELKPWRMNVSLIEPGPTDTALMKEKTVAEFTDKIAAYAAEDIARYFPDYDATVEKVRRFVDRIQRPPRGPFDKMCRLISGTGWLHPPDDVARRIEHALTCRRPKTRYLVGIQARLIHIARRRLGDRAFDRFLGEKVFDF